MTVERTPRVLLVDDEEEVLELYGQFLEDSYEVHLASSGRQALEVLSDDIDVVLLDRRMPEMSGSEVLETIRERGYDCRVAMVTAVSPDMDVIEMGFEDYVVKPVTRAELENVVDSLINWEGYDDVLEEYFELARKAALLEDEHREETLESDPQYRDLTDRLDALRMKADEALPDDDSALYDQIVNSVSGESLDDPAAEFPSDSP